MRASSSGSAGNRRGLGAMVAFVVWVVAIALVYALVQGQAQQGAWAGVARVAGLRLVLFAGQSALAEASWVIRHPAPGATPALTGGETSGTALEPEGTRAAYRTMVEQRILAIEPVSYRVVTAPRPQEGVPGLVDLAVRVRFEQGGVRLTRRVRQRFLGRPHVIRATLGPSKGRVVLASYSLEGRPLFEVIEP